MDDVLRFHPPAEEEADPCRSISVPASTKAPVYGSAKLGPAFIERLAEFHVLQAQAWEMCWEMSEAEYSKKYGQRCYLKDWGCGYKCLSKLALPK